MEKKILITQSNYIPWRGYFNAISKVDVFVVYDEMQYTKRDWRNIFRPGFSTKKAGWGLGLSLSKRIIQDIHGGQLHVLKSTVNKGTVIQIIL